MAMDRDDERRMKALEIGKGIVKKRYRNPPMQNQSLAENVESEIGAPSTQTPADKERAAKALQTFLKRRGLEQGLPRLSERGGPGMKYSETGGHCMNRKEKGNPNKDDLKEISGQLSKASKLHARQSERVGKIAKKIK